jgi:ribosomal protein L37AE/L43A
MSDASPRAVPFYCPFCGEQDLRPADPDGWRCVSCERVFGLSLLRIGGGEGT